MADAWIENCWQMHGTVPHPLSLASHVPSSVNHMGHMKTFKKKSRNRMSTSHEVALWLSVDPDDPGCILTTDEYKV